jgi:hypothetical protein
MTKHSRREREQRAAEVQRVREIEAAWVGSLPKDVAEAFARDVESARARGPLERPADMAPGTAPNPPRPGREPREPRSSQTRSRRGR